jgi:hypothetical protein
LKKRREAKQDKRQRSAAITAPPRPREPENKKIKDIDCERRLVSDFVVHFPSIISDKVVEVPSINQSIDQRPKSITIQNDGEYATITTRFTNIDVNLKIFCSFNNNNNNSRKQQS